jgi:hypothetical protein
MLPFQSRIFSYFFDVQYVQHGLINLGLLFHGQPLPLLGGCEGQDWQNLLGGSPSDANV